MFTAPGGPLQYICEAPLNIEMDVTVIQTDGSVLLMAKPFNKTELRVWDIIQGEPQPNMVGCNVRAKLNCG